MSDDLKSKFWVGILWVDSMVEDWRDKLELAIQKPYTYIVHDRDINGHGDPKKPHVHIMVNYGNPTTANAIKSCFNELSAPGAQCCNQVFRVKDVAVMDDYFLHITKQAKKDKKVQYAEWERIRGLGWNTDLYHQMQIEDRLQAVIDLSNDVKTYNIQTYVDLYEHTMRMYDLGKLEILIAYSSHFDRMVKGQWQKSKPKTDKE